MNPVVTENGCVSQIVQEGNRSWPLVLFRDDEHSGPCWTYRGKRITMVRSAPGELSFTGQIEGLRFSLRYRVHSEHLVLLASIRNTGTLRLTDVQAGIILGIDTYMEKHPAWSDRVFPTMLRCEKTHFWGYLMGPKGQIMTIATPEPIASYQIHYKPGQHRIYTVELIPMTPLSLPKRHQNHLHTLEHGEEKIWTITLWPLTGLNEVKPVAARLTDAQMVDVEEGD